VRKCAMIGAVDCVPQAGFFVTSRITCKWRVCWLWLLNIGSATVTVS